MFMSHDLQDFYTALESRSRLQFNRYLKEGTVMSNYSNVLAMLLRLRQACNHPLLVPLAKESMIEAEAEKQAAAAKEAALGLTATTTSSSSSSNEAVNLPAASALSRLSSDVINRLFTHEFGNIFLHFFYYFITLLVLYIDRVDRM
jgi:hypothetical protein